MAKQRVAVIGAGPAGLVASRYLKSEGFEPVIFEKGDSLGGQWSGDRSRSGVWPGMRTNTCRLMTAFSDLSHPAGMATYPTNQQVRQYLRDFAAKFDLFANLRLNRRVVDVSRQGNDWQVVTANSSDSTPAAELFSHVVVATGKFQKPSIPYVPGIDQFAGAAGIAHTFAYQGPDRYRGRRVLVAGYSISALEIACELAMNGAEVVVTGRRPRYVISKLIGGVPAEMVAFTRFMALSQQHFPPEVNLAGLKQFIERTTGNPARYGAPRPAENVGQAGITLSQHFLPLVAEGRIQVKPWIAEVGSNSVTFGDDSEQSFDGIIFGTGFSLSLPFLSEQVRHAVGPELDLHKLTFHPDLPNIAFLGLYYLVGPFYVTSELQARWIAYTFSGARPAPSREEMELGVAQDKARKKITREVLMPSAAVTFARAAGVEPSIRRWPELTRALMFGPLAPSSFRLDGRDALPEAAARFAADAMMFGAMDSHELTPEQRGQLKALAGASNDPDLVQLARTFSAAESKTAVA